MAKRPKFEASLDSRAELSAEDEFFVALMVRFEFNYLLVLSRRQGKATYTYNMRNCHSTSSVWKSKLENIEFLPFDSPHLPTTFTNS